MVDQPSNHQLAITMSGGPPPHVYPRFAATTRPTQLPHLHLAGTRPAHLEFTTWAGTASTVLIANQAELITHKQPLHAVPEAEEI